MGNRLQDLTTNLMDLRESDGDQKYPLGDAGTSIALSSQTDKGSRASHFLERQEREWIPRKEFGCRETLIWLYYLIVGNSVSVLYLYMCIRLAPPHPLAWIPRLKVCVSAIEAELPLHMGRVDMC